MIRCRAIHADILIFMKFVHAFRGRGGMVQDIVMGRLVLWTRPDEVMLRRVQEYHSWTKACELFRNASNKEHVIERVPVI